MNFLTVAASAAFILAGSFGARGAAWHPTARVDFGTNSAVAFIKDPQRAFVYALDKANDQVLFVSLEEAQIVKRLYVGKRPSGCDIDVTGNFLYVGNEGVGTGLPGSFQIAEIDLRTMAKTRHFVVNAGLIHNSPIRAENVTCGAEGIVYFNSGYDIWNSGYMGIIDTKTGVETGGMASIKSPMVVTSNKERLYGQYVYTGNLGEMGVWDLTTSPHPLVDRFPYSPYPYGWDYNNYVLSGDDKRLALGYVLFTAGKLAEQIGLFPEMIYGLSYDGSVAFGSNYIWDTTTFSVNGNPARLQSLPVSTDLMRYDHREDILYAFHRGNRSLHLIEQCTTRGVSHRWLRQNNLAMEDQVEETDADGDGLSVLSEWMLDESPTETNVAYSIGISVEKQFEIPTRSKHRIYVLQGSDGGIPLDWREVAVFRGNGTNAFYNPRTNSAVMYRVSISVPR